MSGPPGNPPPALHGSGRSAELPAALRELAWDCWAAMRHGQTGDAVAEMALLPDLRTRAAGTELEGLVDVTEAVLRRHQRQPAGVVLACLDRAIERAGEYAADEIEMVAYAWRAFVRSEVGPVEAALVAHAQTRAALPAKADRGRRP